MSAMAKTISRTAPIAPASADARVVAAKRELATASEVLRKLEAEFAAQRVATGEARIDLDHLQLRRDLSHARHRVGRAEQAVADARAAALPAVRAYHEQRIREKLAAYAATLDTAKAQLAELDRAVLGAQESGVGALLNEYQMGLDVVTHGVTEARLRRTGWLVS